MRHSGLLIPFIATLFCFKSQAQKTSIFYKNDVKFAEVITSPELKKGIGCYTKGRENDTVKSGHVAHSYWVTDTICDTNFNSQKFIWLSNNNFLYWEQSLDSEGAEPPEMMNLSPDAKEQYRKDHLRELLVYDKKIPIRPTKLEIIIKNDSIWYDNSNPKTLMYTNTKGNFYQEYYSELDSSITVRGEVTGLGDTIITWKGRKITCFQFEYDNTDYFDDVVGSNAEPPYYRVIKKEIVEKASGLPIMIYEKYYRCKDLNDRNNSLENLKPYRTRYMFIYNVTPANQN